MSGTVKRRLELYYGIHIQIRHLELNSTHFCVVSKNTFLHSRNKNEIV